MCEPVYFPDNEENCGGHCYQGNDDQSWYKIGNGLT